MGSTPTPSSKINKNCVITCITNNYDTLLEPKIVSSGWDHIVLTDDMGMESGVWEVVHVNTDNIRCPKRKANFLCMQFHKHIPRDYETCILIDGSYKIVEDLNELLKRENFRGNNLDLILGHHPDRNCIYQEGTEVIKLKKDSYENVQKHLQYLRTQGYPEQNGLCETGVMIVSVNERVTCFFDFWYSVYEQLPSKRDQLSFNYCLWKHKIDNDIKVDIVRAKNNQRRPFEKYFKLTPHRK